MPVAAWALAVPLFQEAVPTIQVGAVGTRARLTLVGVTAAAEPVAAEAVAAEQRRVAGRRTRAVARLPVELVVVVVVGTQARARVSC